MNNIQFFGNGFPFENKTLEFMQNDYTTALKGIAAFGGSGDFIISGLIQTGANVTEGWIFYNGELIYFEGGVKQSTFIIINTIEFKTYQNGSSNPAYTTKKAKFGTGSSPILFNTLRRLPSLLEIQTIMAGIIGFETEVVIDGCIPSSISTSPTTFDLSAGIVMVNNNIFVVPAYSGQYPLYINEDGQQVIVVPASGNYITFDPYTTQGKASVIRRAIYREGDVLMSTTTSDRFDNTGLGKWEMKGFAMMNGANGTIDMRDRSPIAYDGRGSDPGNGIWDALYNTAGNNAGAKTKVLVAGNLPKVTPGPVAQGEYGTIKRSTPGGDVTIATTDTGGSGNEPDLTAIPQKPDLGGNDDPVNIVHPVKVLVFAQRI